MFAEDDIEKDSLEREQSREPSRGRASSGWRQGVTQASLDERGLDSMRRELEDKDKKL